MSEFVSLYTSKNWYFVRTRTQQPCYNRFWKKLTSHRRTQQSPQQMVTTAHFAEKDSANHQNRFWQRLTSQRRTQQPPQQMVKTAHIVLLIVPQRWPHGTSTTVTDMGDLNSRSIVNVDRTTLWKTSGPSCIFLSFLS